MTGKKPTPVTRPAFADTNVLLYTLNRDLTKARRAYAVMDLRPVVSVQVLNEFASAARYKFGLPWSMVRLGLDHVLATCSVVSLTVESHTLAVDVAEASKIRLYDACIVAAAALAGCKVLYSEDLNAGQVIAGVEVRNPFAGAL